MGLIASVEDRPAKESFGVRDFNQKVGALGHLEIDPRAGLRADLAGSGDELSHHQHRQARSKNSIKAQAPGHEITFVRPIRGSVVIGVVLEDPHASPEPSRQAVRRAPEPLFAGKVVQNQLPQTPTFGGAVLRVTMIVV